MPQLHNIRINQTNYRVEVANTPHLHSLGLSFRPHLSSNHGMLFTFPNEMNRIFHMRNMKIPLDIIFIGADKRVKWIIENAQPNNERLVSLRPSKYVLEVNAGDVKKNNIQIHSLMDTLNNPLIKSSDQWLQKQDGGDGGFSGTAHTSEGTNTFTRTFGSSKDNKKTIGKKNWAKVLTSTPENVSLSLLNEWLGAEEIDSSDDSEDDYVSKSFDDLAVWLLKAVTAEAIASAKGKGLVPKTGTWEKPGRWVRPEDADVPVDEDEASLGTQNVYTANEISDKLLPNVSYKGFGKNKEALNRVTGIFLEALDGIGKPNPFVNGERTIPKWQIDKLDIGKIILKYTITKAGDALEYGDEVAGAVSLDNGDMSINNCGGLLEKLDSYERWSKSISASDPQTLERLLESLPGANAKEDFMGTIIHELGHKVLESNHEVRPWIWAKVEQEYDNAMRKLDSNRVLVRRRELDSEALLENTGFTTKYSSRNPNEFWSECYRAYFKETRAFKELNPEMFELLELMNSTPEDDLEIRPLNAEEIKSNEMYVHKLFSKDAGKYLKAIVDRSESIVDTKKRIEKLEEMRDYNESQGRTEFYDMYNKEIKLWKKGGYSKEVFGAAGFEDYRFEGLESLESQGQIQTHMLVSAIRKAIASGSTREDIEKDLSRKLNPFTEINHETGKVIKINYKDTVVGNLVNEVFDSEIAKYSGYGKEFPWVTDVTKSLFKQDSDITDKRHEELKKRYLNDSLIILDTEGVREPIFGTEEYEQAQITSLEKSDEFVVEDTGFEPLAGTWKKVFVGGEPKWINYLGKIKDFSEFEGVPIQKQSPPGAPPRPGLVWRRSTRRWIRPESGSNIQVGISPTTGEGQKLTRFFGEDSRKAKSYADSLINPDGREPTEDELNTAIDIYQELASVGGAHIEQALADEGFKDFIVKPNFGLFDSEYEPSLFISGNISPDRKDEFTQLMIDIADIDFDQRSVILHEPYEGDGTVEFGVSDELTGESIEPAASLKFEKKLTAKEFNELGKKISAISNGTMGFASHPDGTGIDIINLSVYNTDYEEFCKNLGRFLDDEDVERLSGGIRQHDARAKKTRTVGKQAGPAGFYSEGHYEQRDSYDGLITYDDYRSYYGSKKKEFQELRKQLVSSTCSQCSSNCSCVLVDHTCECYHDCTCPDNSLGRDDVDIVIDVDSLCSLLNLSKAVVSTPMSDAGKFNAKGVETGDSVWITVNDPESPLRGRPILITKRPDGLFSLTGGGGQSKDVEARKHIVLTGTPKESKRDKELKSQISEAEEINSEVVAEKRGIEQEARDSLKQAANAMTAALGISKVDSQKLLDKKDEVQLHVENILGEESSAEAKRITDTIMRQANQANRKISTGVQRERQSVLVKIGRKIRSMRESDSEESVDTNIIPDTFIPQGTAIDDVIESEPLNVESLDEINDALRKFETVSIPLPDISQLKELTPSKQESVIANHFDKQVQSFFDGTDSELDTLEGEDSISEKEDEEIVTVDLGTEVSEPLEIKSQEQLEEAIDKTREYFERRREVQLQSERLKKVPLAVVTPSTLSTLRDAIEAVDVSIDDDELESLTRDNFNGWNRNNQSLAFYDAIGEFWNDSVSLTEEISGAGSKVQSTMKFHMDSGAATALAVLAKEHLGLKIDTRKLMEKGNIELAAASVAWAMRDKYKNDASKLDEIIDSIRTANSTNLSETEKKALERHSNLSKQMEEIQKQKESGELLDKIKISDLERNNLVEQRINLGVSLGSMQASSTLFDQLVKVRTAKDNVLTLNAGENRRDAETIVSNLRLKEGSYDIQPTEAGTWSVLLSSDGLEKHTSQEKDLQLKHDKYDKIKTDETGLSEDDDGNVIVEDFNVPFWNDSFVPEGETDKKIDYKWRAEQRNDINWLLATTEKTDDNPLGEGGGLITRTVGAGKTNTALGFFAYKMQENPEYKSIVAVPKGRAQQWFDEANRFMTLPSGMNIELIPEGASKSDVDDILLNSKPGTMFITGHRELSRSHSMLNEIQTNSELGETIGKFGGICIDEPQELQARGQSGNMGALGRRLMKLPIDHRVGLTATPARRSPLEVYDLVKWSSGAKDIGAKTTFQRTFSGFGSGTNAQDTAIRKVFYETIAPYISGDRITQPSFKVNSDTIDVNRTDSQIQRQRDIESGRETTIATRRQELITEAQGNPSHRLRRGANWETTLPRNATREARKEVESQHQENMDGGDWQNNGRLVALKEQLEGASDKKHVVYIDSKTQRNALTSMLKDMGYTANQIKNIASTTTSISGKEMAQRVKAFRKGDIPFILIDSKSSSGYNLQNGDQLHVIGTPPEAANYVQAQGRIARMPRKGDVDIKTYRYGDSPTEQAHWNDLDAQIKLLRATAPGLFRGQYEEEL